MSSVITEINLMNKFVIGWCVIRNTLAIGAELTDVTLALIGDMNDMNKEVHKIEHKVYEKTIDKPCTVYGRNIHTTDNC